MWSRTQRYHFTFQAAASLNNSSLSNRLCRLLPDSNLHHQSRSLHCWARHCRSRSQCTDSQDCQGKTLRGRKSQYHGFFLLIGNYFSYLGHSYNVSSRFQCKDRHPHHSMSSNVHPLADSSHLHQINTVRNWGLRHSCHQQSSHD